MRKACRLAFLLGSMLNAAQGVAQSDPAAARQRVMELSQTVWLYKLQAAERRNCRRYYTSGERAGGRAYLMRFRTCSDFLLAGGSFDRFFPQLNPNLAPDDKCFETGYRYGYLMENHRQWTPCADELNTAIAQANADAITECRSKAAEQKGMLTDLATAIHSSGRGEIELTDAETYAKILFFTEAGFGTHVWNDILSLAAKAQKDLAMCELILASEIAGDGT